MAFGMEIFNSKGDKVLSTSDFTMRLIYREKFPALTLPRVNYLRSGYVQRAIPGYDPSKCVVMFTPETYNLNPQGGKAQREGKLPTYVNLGGNVIGIRNYSNIYEIHSTGNVYRSFGNIAAHWLEVFEYV